LTTGNRGLILHELNPERTAARAERPGPKEPTMKKKQARRRKPEPRSLIHVGATREAVEATLASIMQIVTSTAASEVKVAALDALTALCKVDHVTFSGCTFTGKP
jgi:hypothetical protein